MKLSRVMPVLTIPRLEQAVPLARALVRGGLRVLEITLRTPVAFDAIRAIKESVPEAIIGVGTITQPAQLARCTELGAAFGVSPGLTPDLAAAVTPNFPLLPAVFTPSELMRAMEWGFSAFKLFPAKQAGGVSMLRALGAVFTDVHFCPTGGVTPENAVEFLSLSNVLCVGGTWIAPLNTVDRSGWDEIENNARRASALRPGR